jgi:hypothetical protein
MFQIVMRIPTLKYALLTSQFNVETQFILPLSICITIVRKRLEPEIKLNVS